MWKVYVWGTVFASVLHGIFGAAPWVPPIDSLLEVLAFLGTFIFGAEFLFRVSVSPSPYRYARSLHGIVDLLAWAPGLLQMLGVMEGGGMVLREIIKVEYLCIFGGEIWDFKMI